MALSVSILEPALSVDPGGFVRTDVRIRNVGVGDEKGRVRVTGPAAPWSWVVPPEVDVPAGDETVVSLGFRVPRTSEPAAGALAFEVTVGPEGDSDATSRTDAGASGTLTVAAFRHVSVELDPPGSGPTTTEHYVVVENHGNVPTTTTLRRSGPGDEVDVTIGVELVETRPGARVVVPVTVRPGKGPLLQTRSLRFAVSAEPAGEEPLSLSGAVHQEPRLGARAAAVAVVAGIVVLGLALRLTVLAPDSSVAVAAGPTTTGDPGPGRVAADVDPRCPATGHTDPMPIGTVRDAESLPKAFSFFAVADGGCQPVRWNPCQPIHYIVNPANAPPTGPSDVKEAFRRLAVATGMNYVDDGLTDETEGGSARAYQPARYGERWAPILIHWRPAGAQAPTGRQTAGGGAATRVGNSYVSGELALTSSIVIDERTQTTIGGGFVDPITIGRIGADGVTWGRVILHELGHIMGLGHTSETDQLMYPDASEHTGTTAFQAGDLAGLEYLGAEAGCTETPPPAPVASRLPGRAFPTTTTTGGP